MKILYFDCVSGISGDMTLSALIDLGVPQEVIVEAVERVVPGEVTFRFESVRSGGVRAIRTSVGLSGRVPPLRHYTDIVAAIEAGPLADGVRDRALAVFRLLAEAEGKVHGVPPERVHFHEVGAWDSIADVVGVSAGIEALGVDLLAASPVPLGRGTVRTEHGILPVPAPATLELVAGMPVVAGPVDGELTTPTGAALLRALVSQVGDMPTMLVRKAGYGAGHRELPGRPNVLRLVLGEGSGEAVRAFDSSEWLVSTNLDDCSPQVAAHVLGRLLQAGALDAWFTPIQMKKNRPGVELSVLCAEELRTRIAEMIFKETTAIGLREVPLLRKRLPREWVEVETRWGAVRVKLCRLDGDVVNAAPEFEDARRLSEEHGVPVREVLAEAVAAWRVRRSLEGKDGGAPPDKPGA